MAARQALKTHGDRPPPLVAVRSGTPTRASGRSPRPTPSTSSGASQLTRRLINRLGEIGPGSRFLAVVGPSGGGKSSVVRAGLVPAIRHGALAGAEGPLSPRCSREHTLWTSSRPRSFGSRCDPVPRLHDRLDSGSRGLLEAVDLVAAGEAEVVLVVDQFEEVFTLTTDERERGAVPGGASRRRRRPREPAPRHRDPSGRLLRPPAHLPEVRGAARRTDRGGSSSHPGRAGAGDPRPRRTGRHPARARAGGGDDRRCRPSPGAFPLLQYALTELFERRDEGRLTLIAYQELGGITGALSARAERIFESTDQQGRRATKQTFLRLVTLGEGRQDTRRRVTRSELDALDVEREAIDIVVDIFGRHRLLTFDREPSTREPTVEIAHEALLSAWGRLRTWIDDAREDLRQERGLARATAEWRGSDGDRASSCGVPDWSSSRRGPRPRTWRSGDPSVPT